MDTLFALIAFLGKLKKRILFSAQKIKKPTKKSLYSNFPLMKSFWDFLKKKTSKKRNFVLSIIK